MDIHYLEYLFEPRSVAVIGASNQPSSVGTKVFDNLLQSFTGKLYPANPKHKEIAGNPCFASVKEINQPVDLAVIVTPAATVPQIMAECGTKHIPYAVIISAGFSETNEAGRNPQGSQAALSHTAAMIGPDEVFSAVLHQTGTLRVMTIEQLFSAAKVFSDHRHIQDNRLFIITNGGGAGVIAADRAADLGITLANHNPIDILGDATPARYQEVITACLNEKSCDGLLVILVPVAMSQPLEVAQQIVKLNEQTDKPILVCWIGQKQIESLQELFIKNKIPCFTTPEAAIDAFFYLASYQSQQQFLQQAFEPTPHRSPINISEARSIIDASTQEHRTVLTALESKALLKAFGIPVTQTIAAQSIEDAITAAKRLGFPLVMKIHSPDITHKQDVGGVRLNITQPNQVAEIYKQMLNEVKEKCPHAKILGITLKPVYKTPYDRELIVGISSNPVFGPTISFGAGGTAVEIWHDYAIALPPLNSFITHDLIQRTRVSKLLAKFRHMPAANLAAIQ